MFALVIGNRLAQSIFARNTIYGSNVPPIEWDQDTITEFFSEFLPPTLIIPFIHLQNTFRYLMIFNEFCSQRNITFQ